MAPSNDNDVVDVLVDDVIETTVYCRAAARPALTTGQGRSYTVRTDQNSEAGLSEFPDSRANYLVKQKSAVNASFFSALEDPDFGFGDVSPRTMLEHLRTEYGTLTPEELEKNRAALSEPWNFDDPIQDLWAKIIKIQRVAAFGAVPIPDITIITTTRAMIEKTGLLATTTEKFRLQPLTEWTVALFKVDFV